MIEGVAADNGPVDAAHQRFDPTLGWLSEGLDVGIDRRAAALDLQRSILLDQRINHGPLLDPPAWGQIAERAGADLETFSRANVGYESGPERSVALEPRVLRAVPQSAALPLLPDRRV